MLVLVREGCGVGVVCVLKVRVLVGLWLCVGVGGGCCWVGWWV